MRTQAYRVDLAAVPPSVTKQFVSWRKNRIYIETHMGGQRVEAEFQTGKHAWFDNKTDAERYAEDWAATQNKESGGGT